MAENEKDGGLDIEARILEEWGDVWAEISDPALERIGVPVAYLRPFTLADLGKIKRHAEGDHYKTLIYTLIFKLMDENGDPIFTIKHKPLIENKLPSDDVSRLVKKINETGGFEPRAGK